MTPDRPKVSRATQAAIRAILTFSAVIAVAGFMGCKKSNDQTHPAAIPTTVVVLLGPDIKPDGSLTPAGLAKVQAKSDAAHLTIAFSRAPVGDAALPQLAQFPNVKRIEAFGSNLTAAGVDKLKQSSPDISVGY